MKRHLLVFVAVGLSIVLTHFLSQRIGDELLWSSPQKLSLSLEREPCIALQKRISSPDPLPPAAQVLVQRCIQSSIFEFSAKNLAQILETVAPQDIASSLRKKDGIASSYVAMALFPSLEKRVQDLCSQSRFSQGYCLEDRLRKAKSSVERHLAEMILQENDADLLRGMLFACSLKARAQNIAKDLETGGRRVKGASRFLRSCSLPRERAISELKELLHPEEDLLAIVALELRRLRAKEAQPELEALLETLPSGVASSMVKFALEGLQKVETQH